jgi:hypothetical protein
MGKRRRHHGGKRPERGPDHGPDSDGDEI